MEPTAGRRLSGAVCQWWQRAWACVARRHAGRLDIPYLEETLRPICELAEDMVPWSRLQRVLAAVRSPDA